LICDYTFHGNYLGAHYVHRVQQYYVDELINALTVIKKEVDGGQLESQI